VLLQPDLLILDEPTNHINFRHLPIIADALNEFRGGALSANYPLPALHSLCFTACTLLSPVYNLLSAVWSLLIATLYASLLS
jgi:ATPase subunit of ABC transporter with duplicated ATPase domains